MKLQTWFRKRTSHPAGGESLPETASQPDSDFGAALQSARGGSQAALGAVLDACRNHLLRIANKELPAGLRAKVCPCDLVQETFLQAQRDFRHFAGADAAHFTGWLCGILRH